jgi:hypothetical protein
MSSESDRMRRMMDRIERLSIELAAARAECDRFGIALTQIAQGKNDPIGVNTEIARKALES